MLSGPELARLQNQFEEQCMSGTDPEHPRNFQNHEQELNGLFNSFINPACLGRHWYNTV